MFAISALGRQRLVDPCDLLASQSGQLSSRSRGNPVSIKVGRQLLRMSKVDL